MGAPASPLPHGLKRFTFLWTNDLVDFSSALYWKSTIISAVLMPEQPSWTIRIFLFLFFLNIHKVISAPKKSVLKFNGLSNIQLFKVRSWLPVFSSYCLQYAFLDNLIFKISRRTMPPHHPRGSRFWFVSTLDRTLPQKNLLTGQYSNRYLYSCLKTFFKLIVDWGVLF